MSGHDDYTAERFQRHMDDELMEAILTGRKVGPDFAPLTAFVKDVRTVASGPLPVPSLRMTTILAEGFSTDKGDLLATAASNANGPDLQESGLSKWRRLKMLIAKFVAGLGLAAKVGLSVGVAAASVTAAGAAGVLPGPAQHEISGVINNVTPFSAPDGGSHPVHPEPTTVPTTVPPPTTVPKPKPPLVGEPTVTTPTTVPHHAEPTTVPAPPAAAPPITPTSEVHVAATIALTCGATGSNAVTCNWTAAPAGSARFVLLRTTATGPGRVELDTTNMSTTAFTDTTVSPGGTYGYRVDALRADGSVAATSNFVEVAVPSAAPAAPAPAAPASHDTPTSTPPTTTTPPTTGPHH